ncbi:MAG TPA: zinc ribbon domain-containing protein [Candidatus Coproplasma excrementipullorum]|nr:zinc ribbon domain-containing protein [Candidatus Coproplasma excrementipullorum]
MLCKNCGAENPEGAVYCHNCGSRMDGMRACLSCGSLMSPDYEFCTACGRADCAAAALFYSPPPFQG